MHLSYIDLNIHYESGSKVQQKQICWIVEQSGHPILGRTPFESRWKVCAKDINMLFHFW